MFARGKLRQEDLSSVGRFFSRGSTIERATAFTTSALAFERNAAGLTGVSGRPNQRSRPSSIADELDACHEHPVQEMQVSIFPIQVEVVIISNIICTLAFAYYCFNTTIVLQCRWSQSFLLLWA